MSQYKGHEITPTITHFPTAGRVSHVAYSILRNGTPVRDGVVYGPFSNLEDAFSAADVAARGWIDLQGL